MSELAAAKGSYLKVVVPEGTSLRQGTFQCGVTGMQNYDGVTCTAEGQTIWFPLQKELGKFEQDIFLFKNVFYAPLTSEMTPSYTIELYRTDKTTLISGVYEGVTMTDLEPALLVSTSLQINQVDSAVVGSFTKSFFSVTPLNPIPAGGGVQVELPKWDWLAPSAVRQSYLS